MKKQTLTDRRLSQFEHSLETKVPRLSGRAHKLEEIVRQHGVCWDLCPEYHVDRDEKLIQIGFEFSLMGAHQHSEWVYELGCPECVAIYEDLQRIAEWLAPKERRKGLYEIVIMDASPYYSSYRRAQPEVLLVIKVINREGFEDSVDPCEAKCLTEMTRRAKELGIPQHVGSSLSTGVSTAVH